jgi:hypothetical protein
MKTNLIALSIAIALAWAAGAPCAEIVVTHEFIYPSAWTEPQVQAGTSSTTGGTGSVGIASPSPAAWTTREIGVRLYVYAIIGGQKDTGIALGKSPTPGRLTDGNTALMMAAASGDEATATALLESDRGVNDRNRFGSTALMGAAAGGYQKIVEQLVAKGADVNLANRDGVTPLMVAAKNGYENTVRFLLANGAKVNAEDSSDQTALMYAAATSSPAVVKALLEKGANVKIESRNGTTALVAARARHDDALVILLTKAGATR